MSEQRIPLEQVAADQRQLIAAFREGGEQSFQTAASVGVARENYEQSCAANGLPADAVARVEDVEIDEFRVRVYDPREDAAVLSGVVVFAHGGGWVIGSLDTHDTVCRRIATLTGMPVVAVDYRLGPEHRFPAGHLDCRRAVEWVRDEAPSRGWDAQRLVTCGDSAGGGMAAVLAADASMLVPGTTVVAQVLLYPMLDVANESPGYARIQRGFPLTADSLRWFVENYVADRADTADSRLSPLVHLREDAPAQPPAFILGLGLDPLGDEAVEYAARLTHTGTHVELLYLPHHAHGLFTSAGKIATGAQVLELAAGFMRRFAG